MTELGAAQRRPSPEQSSSLAAEVKFNGIAVSGFVDKGKNFADPFAFSALFKSGKWTSITTVTDNVSFAKKRLVNPNTVYSGLIDVIKYAEVSPASPGATGADMVRALAGSEAWLAYGLTPEELPAAARAAAEAGLKRVVFAVKVGAAEMGADVEFSEATEALRRGGVAFTLFKYAAVRKMGEAKFPFRIVRGVLPLPTSADTFGGEVLSSDDLMRILVEVRQPPTLTRTNPNPNPNPNSTSSPSLRPPGRGYP